MNLKQAKITPKKADSINQLQELYQKKYIGAPYYEFDQIGEEWQCICLCDDVQGEATAKRKADAKKKAAYMTLCNLFRNAGVKLPGANTNSDSGSDEE